MTDQNGREMARRPHGSGGTHQNAARGEDSRAQELELSNRARRLAMVWANQYKTLWALQEAVVSDAQRWSTTSAGELVRGISTPNISLAVTAGAMIAIGTTNLVVTILQTGVIGVLGALLVGSAGAVVVIGGYWQLLTYLRLLRGHRARMGRRREELRTQLQRHALAAVSARRERLAGPRRPVPRFSMEHLLPVQAHHVAAAWMRHLGELDAMVPDPDEVLRDEHLLATGYVGRVWAATTETPEKELELLHSTAAAMGRRPILFSLGEYSGPMIARANRIGIGLFHIETTRGTIASRNQVAEKCLSQGLRDTDGIATGPPIVTRACAYAGRARRPWSNFESQRRRGTPSVGTGVDDA